MFDGRCARGMEEKMKLFTHLSANNIKLVSMPFLRELAMEAYLIENESVLSLSEDDFDQVQIIDFELPVSNGRVSKNTDGRIDLLVLYSNETFGIIELKNANLNKENFRQLSDYFENKEEVFNKHKSAVSNDYANTKWIGVLVGTNIDENLRNEIIQGKLKIQDKIPVAAIIINRYRSDTGQVFVTTDVYFKTNQRNLDRTRYIFDGTDYGKGRLVHAVIKKYLQENKNITYSELENIFPKTIQGNHGVFDTLENANELYSRYRYKRHFLNEEDVLIVGNTQIAICSQWGIGNINNFLKLVEEQLKYKISVL